MRIHRDGFSLTLKDGQNPCQESAISLEWLKFYSGRNYGLGWGSSLITSTSHEHVFCPSHEHGSSLVHDHGSLSTSTLIIHPWLNALKSPLRGKNSAEPIRAGGKRGRADRDPCRICVEPTSKKLAHLHEIPAPLFSIGLCRILGRTNHPSGSRHGEISQRELFPAPWQSICPRKLSCRKKGHVRF